MSYVPDSPFYFNWFLMHNRALAYMGVAVGSVVFSTVLAFWKNGGQPAAFGHLQTLADLIDDWGVREDGRFWWGDKGGMGGVRHAGTSCSREELGVGCSQKTHGVWSPISTPPHGVALGGVFF